MRLFARNPAFVGAALVGAALLTSGCLSSSSGGTASPAASGSGTGAATGTVKIWTSVDQPVMDGLKSDLAAKLPSGITVQWSRVDNINQIIMTKLAGNDAPDIALIPQPGVVADIVKRGKAQPLDNVVDMAALKSSMVPGTLDAGTVGGKLYGLLVSMNVKSLVFYPKKYWDSKGYTVPTSIDELNALSGKMVANGETPWCMATGSGTATGWPATDWFEDLVMRYGSVQQYNDWVSHKIKFDSPLVRQAAAEYEKLAFTPGYSIGGRKAISSNDFGKVTSNMFTSPKPGCVMIKQGSFITGFMPTAVQKDLDNQVGVFYFPPATAGGDKPVLGGGDLATLLSTSPAAAAVMKLLGADDLGVTAAKNSSFLSPHKNFPVTNYPGKLTQSVAQIAYQSTAFLFDGSDQMPAAVGTGTFWKDTTAWISGGESLDTALKNIDSSWPTS
jgi:alpha-glucoside transport system substrate-binding protein